MLFRYFGLKIKGRPTERESRKKQPLTTLGSLWAVDCGLGLGLGLGASEPPETGATSLQCTSVILRHSLQHSHGAGDVDKDGLAVGSREPRALCVR